MSRRSADLAKSPALAVDHLGEWVGGVIAPNIARGFLVAIGGGTMGP